MKMLEFRGLLYHADRAPNEIQRQKFTINHYKHFATRADDSIPRRVRTNINYTIRHIICPRVLKFQHINTRYPLILSI